MMRGRPLLSVGAKLTFRYKANRLPRSAARRSRLLHFCVERMMRFTNESETPTPVRPGPFPAPAGWAISRIHLEARSRSAGSRRQGSECYRLRDHRLAGSRREFNASEVVEETFADPLPIGMAWVWMQDPV